MKILSSCIHNSHHISIQTFLHKEPAYIKNFINTGNHLKIFSEIKKTLQHANKNSLSDFSIFYEPDKKDTFIQISFFTKNRLDPMCIRKLEDLMSKESLFEESDNNFNDETFLNELDDEILILSLSKEAELLKRLFTLKKYMLRTENKPNAENLIKMIYATVLMLIAVSDKKINLMHLFSSILKRTK